MSSTTPRSSLAPGRRRRGAGDGAPPSAGGGADWRPTGGRVADRGRRRGHRPAAGGHSGAGSLLGRPRLPGHRPPPRLAGDHRRSELGNRRRGRDRPPDPAVGGRAPGVCRQPASGSEFGRCPGIQASRRVHVRADLQHTAAASRSDAPRGQSRDSSATARRTAATGRARSGRRSTPDGRLGRGPSLRQTAVHAGPFGGRSARRIISGPRAGGQQAS